MSTVVDPIFLDWRREQWNMWLEEAKIFEITSVARTFGFGCKVVITNGLLKHLSPFAEEAVKGHSFEERVCELLQMFKRRTRFAVNSYLEFDYKFSHNVADDKDFLNPETFSRSRDKEITIFAGKLIDDEGNPALIFGVKKLLKVA